MDEVYKRIGIRVLLCVLCTGLAEYAPGFVHIVSFIGCFCVSIVGFVLPPLFCIQLRHNNCKDRTSKMDFLSYCDIGALVIGIITTILTSTMTFGELRRSQQQQNRKSIASITQNQTGQFLYVLLQSCHALFFNNIRCISGLVDLYVYVSLF